ncbi:MAG: hypothetical protein LBC76_04990 [Treponema sp.]|jgi:hypothetical protein|nr:hypothetical protein [Treponema sp.]
MKKLALFLFICLFFLPRIYADNDKGKLRIKDRTVEFGLNAKAGFTNDFLSAKDFFQKTIVLDLDKIKNGISINFDANASPLYFNYNNKNNWGFGLSIKTDIYGILGLSGKMLSFSEAVDEKSDISAAVFTEAGIPVFFHLHKLKIKIKPALYYPVIYAVSDISYTYSTDNKGTLLNFTYDINVYSAYSLENYNGITASPGVDFQLGVEYPLSNALGLKDKFFMLDFDLGLDIVNIPLLPSSVQDYMKISGNIGSDKPFIFGDDDSAMEKIFTFSSDTTYGVNKRKVLRPFKMIARSNWRPFGIQLFTVIPEAGFALNPLYSKPFSMEAGLKTRLDISNFFIATFGMGFYDRLWRNSLDLALNLKAFEIDLGVDLRSQSYLKSWTGSGFGVNAGFKFGW